MIKNSPKVYVMPHALNLTIGQQILSLNERTKRRQLLAMEQNSNMSVDRSNIHDSSFDTTAPNRFSKIGLRHSQVLTIDQIPSQYKSTEVSTSLPPLERAGGGLQQNSVNSYTNLSD